MNLEFDEEESGCLMILAMYLHNGREAVEELMDNAGLSEDGTKVANLMIDHVDNGTVIFPRGDHAIIALQLLQWRKQRLFELDGTDSIPAIPEIA